MNVICKAQNISMFILVLVLFPFSGNAQVTIGTNNPPDPSAILDLQSSTSGLLLPQLTTAQRNGIANPHIGLQIYNTDTDCLEMFFASGGWKPVQCGCNAFPNATFNLTNGSINLPVSLSSPVPNMTYSWSFQSGNPATSSSQTNQVTWTNAGTYSVSLTLTDSAGCSASYTGNITISNCTPVSINLTNCGQTGSTGPSQGQANSAYGPNVVTVNNGIQQWVVPVTGTYTITVAGAQGGNGYAISSSVLLPGEQGAIVSGDINLVQGDILYAMVGQQGVQPQMTGTPGGGGGGTFVIKSGSPLIVAGAGTGNGNYGASKGVTTTSGANNASGVLGGTNGNGGNGGSRGGGGGGYLTNGLPPSLATSSNPGFSYLNGGAGAPGADYGCSWLTGVGGFGGGAAGGGACNPNGGAGGGYSGGAGGSNNLAGGGGSYIAGSFTNISTSNGQYDGSSSFNGVPVQNLNLYNSGHGYVTIIKTCP